MTAQKKLTVRILPELSCKIDKIAKKKGVSKNALIVQALWELVGGVKK